MFLLISYTHSLFRVYPIQDIKIYTVTGLPLTTLLHLSRTYTLITIRVTY